MSVSEPVAEMTTAVIVDDTPDIRLLVRLALERDGDFLVVGEAGDGLEGVDVVGRTQPDLVFLDLAMPVMDGLEALPRIRRVSPGARIVVLSGFAVDTMAQRALKAGADGYLQKGTSATEILAYARRVTGGAPQPVARATPAAQPDPAPVAPPIASPRLSEAERRANASAAANLAAEWLPCGVVVVRGAMSGPGDIAYLNDAAVRQLGLLEGCTGGPVAALSQPLLAVLARRRSDLGVLGETSDRMTLPAGAVQFSLRRLDDDVLVTLHSVGDNEEAERLRHAISTTAHEIRNPVTVLLGVAEAIEAQGEQLGPERTRQLLAAVARQADILDRVTDDLLTAAQARRGQVSVNLAPVDLSPVIANAVGDLPADVDVEVGGTQGAWVMADLTRLRQMLANLLSNALKYGHPPYRIHVSHGRLHSQRTVHIAVSDSGPGVREDFRHLLFEEFTRADESHARGTGLGLFLVRSFAEAHGGWAAFAPHHNGGSIFTVTLLAPPE